MITLTSNINRMFDTGKSPTWIVKLTLDDATRYYSNQNVTISGIEYPSRFVVEDGVGDINQSVDITLGGNSAAVGNLSILLNEIVTQEGFHRSFKPHTAGTELTNRPVEIGMIYNYGTLSDSDVVWLYKGLISDFDISLNGIDADVIGSREIDEIDLPQTLISSENYPYAPKENKGLPLPILYGDFETSNSIDIDGVLSEKVSACPSVCINKAKMVFCVADHITADAQSFAGSGVAFYHDGSIKTFASIASESINGVNNDTDDSGISTITIPPGQIVILLDVLCANAGSENALTDFENAIDGDKSTYCTVQDGASEVLALQIEGVPTGDLRTYARIHTYAVGTHNFDVGYLADGETIGSFHLLANHSSASDTLYGDDILVFPNDCNTVSKYQFVIKCDSLGQVVNVGSLGVELLIIMIERNISIGQNRGRFRDRVRQ